MSMELYFDFFNYKSFFWPIWCVSFCKNIFVFGNSYMIINFKFRIFIINCFDRVNICILLYVSLTLVIFNIWFNLNCSMVCIFVFIYYIIYTLFWYWSHVFVDFSLKVLINLSATTDFSLVMYWIHFRISLSFNHFLKELL